VRSEQKFIVDKVGTPDAKERYFMPASKSILDSAVENVRVLTLIILFVVVATKAGLAALTACTVAAAFVT